MATDNVKTPSELADEAMQTARDAVQAAQGYARESGRIGRDAAQSIRWTVEDAKDTGAQVLDTVKGLPSDAADIAKDAAGVGRSYARNAVGATGRTLRDWKGQVSHARARCEQYVADQPVRSSLIAVASGVVLMIVMLSLIKRRPNYES